MELSHSTHVSPPPQHSSILPKLTQHSQLGLPASHLQSTLHKQPKESSLKKKKIDHVIPLHTFSVIWWFQCLMPDISPSLTLTTFNYIIQNLSEMTVYQVLKTYMAFLHSSSLLRYWPIDLRSQHMTSAKGVFPLYVHLYYSEVPCDIFLMSKYINFKSFNKVFSF